jgi:hypothetical protein
MRADERLFSTWGVFFPAEDPLFRCCDGYLHWDCYAAWPERARFARAYFDMWARMPNPFWGTVLADDDVLLTVNPSPLVASLWLVLVATGTRRSVSFGDWPRFVTEGPGTFPHAIEREAFEAVQPRLRDLGTDPAGLVARAVFPPPPPPDPALVAQKEEQRRIRRWNRAARRAAEAVAAGGAACPSCGARRVDHRFVDCASRRVKSFFVCAACAASFTHEDLARAAGGEG